MNFKKCFSKVFGMHNLLMYIFIFVIIFLISFFITKYNPILIPKTNWTLLILVFNIISPIAAIGTSFHKMSELRIAALELSNEERYRLKDNINVRLRSILYVFLFLTFLSIFFSFAILTNNDTNIPQWLIAYAISLTICATLLLCISWFEADEINQFKSDVIERHKNAQNQAALFEKKFINDKDKNG